LTLRCGALLYVKRSMAPQLACQQHLPGKGHFLPEEVSLEKLQTAALPHGGGGGGSDGDRAAPLHPSPALILSTKASTGRLDVSPAVQPA
jgi:hypothetical protein